MDFDNSNGLIGLKRNIVLRLVKFLDAQKTRNVVGIGSEIYSWTKLSLWNWAISAFDLPLTFLPNDQAESFVEIVGSLFRNLGNVVENCFFLDEEMKRGVYKVVFISNGNKDYERFTGLVHKSRFDYFYTFTTLTSGSCFVCNSGIICGDSWVLREKLFSHEGELHTTTLELDMERRTYPRTEDRDKDKIEDDSRTIEEDEGRGTLRALADGKQIPYAITRVPQSVHFALDVWCLGSIQVVSFQRLKVPSIDSKLETVHFKWK